jgi:hypothetical protein
MHDVQYMYEQFTFCTQTELNSMEKRREKRGKVWGGGGWGGLKAVL